MLVISTITSLARVGSVPGFSVGVLAEQLGGDVTQSRAETLSVARADVGAPSELALLTHISGSSDLGGVEGGE